VSLEGEYKTMMNRIAISAALLAGVMSAQAVVTGSISGMTTFGDLGTGWMTPNAVAPYIVTGGSGTNNTRGVAYGNGQVYVATRQGGTFIHILNATTGQKIGNLNMAGVSGGSGASLTNVRVDSDGRIYASNLVVNASTSNLKVYRWDNDGATATVVYNAANPAAIRLGDSMDLIGGGTNVRMAFGINNTTAGAVNQGYTILDQDSTNANNFLATNYSFPSPFAPGDARLGITFLGDRDTLLNAQSGTTGRQTSIAGGVPTFTATRALTSASERGMDYTVIDGVGVLATVDTASSLVRIYDMTTTGNPILLSSADLNGSLAADNITNGNGTSALAWGAVSGKTAKLYMVNTNNGVHAFNVTVVPEPATMTALAFGLAAIARRRKQK
jgi:hypothetical protein